jgi:hypothetical protein
MPDLNFPPRTPSSIPAPIRRLLAALVLLTALALPTARAQELFREVPGSHLLSGQMIVRPIQAADWCARDVSMTEANARLAAAREHVLKLPVKKEIPQTGSSSSRCRRGGTRTRCPRR